MVDVIEKHADPVKQKRLKASKKAWNATVKLLIAKLIAFKRGINGAGDTDAELPEVDLKDPFPVEFNTYLSSIIDDYQKVVSGAEFVMDAQEDFSKTRRKSKREERTVEFHEASDQLTAEASWWGSRAWARVALYSLDKETRRTRLDMLRWVNKSVHDLHDIENSMTSKESDGDAKAIMDMLNFVNHFVGTLVFRLHTLEEREASKKKPELPQGQPPAEGDGEGEEAAEGDVEPGDIVPGSTVFKGKPPAPPAVTDISAIQKEVFGEMAVLQAKAVNADIPNKDKQAIETNYAKIMKALLTDDESQNDVIISLYNVLRGLFAQHREKISQADSEAEELCKEAHNALSRWLRRKWMGTFPSRTDDMRLIIIDDLHDLIRHLNTLMDRLEDSKSTTADIAESIWSSAGIAQGILRGMSRLARDYYIEWKKDPKKGAFKLDKGIGSDLAKAEKSLYRSSREQLTAQEQIVRLEDQIKKIREMESYTGD